LTIPGSNILNMAMGLIGAQTVGWLQFTGFATNAAGVDVPNFAAPVDVPGSFQAVPFKLVQELGLDWSKTYGTFYASRNFGDPERDKTGDRLTYAGKVWQIVSKTTWHAQDGWDYVLCVELTYV